MKVFLMPGCEQSAALIVVPGLSTVAAYRPKLSEHAFCQQRKARTEFIASASSFPALDQPPGNGYMSVERGSVG